MLGLCLVTFIKTIKTSLICYGGFGTHNRFPLNQNTFEEVKLIIIKIFILTYLHECQC